MKQYHATCAKYGLKIFNSAEARARYMEETGGCFAVEDIERSEQTFPIRLNSYLKGNTITLGQKLKYKDCDWHVIITHIGDSKIIAAKNGNLWANPVRVDNYLHITKSELIKILAAPQYPLEDWFLVD